MQHDTLAPWAERAPNSPERMTAVELLALPDNGGGTSWWKGD